MWQNSGHDILVDNLVQIFAVTSWALVDVKLFIWLGNKSHSIEFEVRLFTCAVVLFCLFVYARRQLLQFFFTDMPLLFVH